MQNRFLGIIPARYASTRFPGKPLAVLGDKPMIRWVYERASAKFKNLAVATDDERIKEVVEGFGGNALMTSSRHKTGTERCAEAAVMYQQGHGLEITHVVNIQGDEPLLKNEHLEALMTCFTEGDTQIATLIQPLKNEEDLINPNVVKVVVDRTSRALYFSRSPIPFVRETTPESLVERHIFYTHIGLYAYRLDVLKELVQLPETSLEKTESLEQLRWLEHGYSIRTRVTEYPSLGVDTLEDLEAIRKLL